MLALGVSLIWSFVLVLIQVQRRGRVVSSKDVVAVMLTDRDVRWVADQTAGLEPKRSFASMAQTTEVGRNRNANFGAGGARKLPFTALIRYAGLNRATAFFGVGKGKKSE